MTDQCPSCGSTRFVSSGRLRPQYLSILGWLRFYLWRGFLGSGKFVGEIRGKACVDCGRIELYVADPAGLKAAYLNQQGEMVHLDLSRG